MKTQTLIASLIVTTALSSFGQGTVAIKTTISKNPIYVSTDEGRTTVLLDSSGTVPGQSGGTVNYDALIAPSGTPALTQSQLALGGYNIPNTWTVIPLNGASYTANGVLSPAIDLTVPLSIAPNGGAVEMEIVAYAGGTFDFPYLWGYSGSLLPASITTTGAMTWLQNVSNPTTTPPGTPIAVVSGPSGLGSLLIVDSPEPSTLAIGVVGAASLLLFRRRK
jgi:hypothetical protein